jgi:hypothetical protein
MHAPPSSAVWLSSDQLYVVQYMVTNNVTSSTSPRFDLNPNVEYVLLIFNEYQGAPVTVTGAIWRDRGCVACPQTDATWPVCYMNV